jgi:phage tail-like protein
MVAFSASLSAGASGGISGGISIGGSASVAAGVSGVGVRNDPVLAYDFVIGLVDSSSSMAAAIAMASVLSDAIGGFSECSGLEMTMQPEEYKEGGNNGATLKFPSRVAWSNIVLKRGIASDTSLWDWQYGFVTGTGTRKDGFIALLNDMHQPNSIWIFQRGLPVKYTGPSMNAMQSNVAIETIEIGHEGLWQMPLIGAAASAVSAGISVGASAGIGISVSAGASIGASVSVGGGAGVNAGVSVGVSL